MNKTEIAVLEIARVIHNIVSLVQNEQEVNGSRIGMEEIYGLANLRLSGNMEDYILDAISFSNYGDDEVKETAKQLVFDYCQGDMSINTLFITLEELEEKASNENNVFEGFDSSNN